MLLVEKCQQTQSFSYSTDYRTSIAFFIYPDGSSQQSEIYVELSTASARKATVRLVDEEGNTLMLAHECFEPGQSRLSYTIRNIEPGTYFFEVTDGFFYQIKELQVSKG